MHECSLLAISILTTGITLAQDKPPRIPDDVELRPGLVAAYGSRGHVRSFERIDLTPAFTCLNGAVDPRLGPEKFWIRCSGVFFLREAEPVRFGAFVRGQLAVTIDGKEVLRGTGVSVTTWISGAETFQREPGLYRITIEYHSGDLSRVPA